MTPAETALLRDIEALVIDPPGAKLTFVGRLARENDWAPYYAAAVVQEYRRFLFLAAIETQPMTPSDTVDQAWHLHLAYTRSYWDDLCGLLGRPLHHGPSAGGGGEAARYRRQYAATLAAYEATFGTAPRDDIWPAVEHRFAGRFVRVDRDAMWVLSKQPAWVGAAAAGAALILVEGGSLLWIATPVFVVAALGMIVIDRIRGKTGHRRKRGCGSSCGGDGGDRGYADGGSDGDSSGDGGGDGGGGGCGGD